MTCREKLSLEHPECIDPEADGGCMGCPRDYGYMGTPQDCADGGNDIGQCDECWDREISGETVLRPHIKDSGDRTQFASGAVRDMHEGKGRCDLLPLDVVADLFVDHDQIFGDISCFQDTGNYHYLIHAVNIFKSREWTIHSKLLEVAKHFEEGCKKYGENNWQKGIPVKCYIDSAVRHYLKYLRGDKDEPHDRAFCWNILCAIWTCKHKPELNDYARKEDAANEESSN